MHNEAALAFWILNFHLQFSAFLHLVSVNKHYIIPTVDCHMQDSDVLGFSLDCLTTMIKLQLHVLLTHPRPCVNLHNGKTCAACPTTLILPSPSLDLWRRRSIPSAGTTRGNSSCAATQTAAWRCGTSETPPSPSRSPSPTVRNKSLS